MKKKKKSFPKVTVLLLAASRSASGWERCGKCESSTDLLQ